MTQLKLNKAALGVALAFASSAALAANTVGIYTVASVADGTDTLVAETARTVPYQFTGNQIHDVNGAGKGGAGANGSAYEIVYSTTSSGVINSGFLEFNVANGAFDGTDTYYLVRMVDQSGADRDVEATAVGTMFAQTVDGNGHYTSITFQINAAANVGLNEELVLTTIDPSGDADDNAFPVNGQVNIFANADLTASDNVSVSVEGQTPAVADFNPADAPAANLVNMEEGLILTADITEETSDVDLAGGGTAFTAAGNTIAGRSTAVGLEIDFVNLDEDLSLADAGDTIRVAVMGDNCDAVNDSLASVEFGNLGVSDEDATSKDYANCTWTYDVAGNAASGIDFTDGDGDISIFVNGTDQIDTANWTYSISVDIDEDNEVNFFDLTSGTPASHDWNASIEGGVAYIPYMFAFNGDTTNWSLAKVHNRSNGSIEVAARVTAKQCDIPCTTGTSTRHTDYLLGSVAANDIMQLTGDTILAALNAPTGMATDGYNETAAGLDLTKLYHLSVELVFVNTDADMVDVEVQNSASAGRSTANVSYEMSGTYSRSAKSN